MPATLERAQLRHQIPRALDRNGRQLFRATVDRSAVVERKVTRADGSEGDAIGFTGHAIVFNSRTWIGSKRWGFWEEIAPEAVTDTIANDDIRMLQNHNPDLLLARNTSGTLRLDPDDTGLGVDADMARTSYALDLAILLGRGDLTQMSFAFEDEEWTYSEAEDGNPLYRLTKIRMFDVAPVTYPAYTDTDAGLRSAAFAQLSRAAGLSPTDEVELIRHLATGDQVDPQLIASVRAAAPAAAPETAPAAPAARTDSPPAPADEATTNPRAALAARTRAVRHSITKETI